MDERDGPRRVKSAVSSERGRVRTGRRGPLRPSQCGDSLPSGFPRQDRPPRPPRRGRPSGEMPRPRVSLVARHLSTGGGGAWLGCRPLGLLKVQVLPPERAVPNQRLFTWRRVNVGAGTQGGPPGPGRQSSDGCLRPPGSWGQTRAGRGARLPPMGRSQLCPLVLALGVHGSLVPLC